MGVEEDERFRRILKRTAILFLIFALVFPFLMLVAAVSILIWRETRRPTPIPRY